MPVPLTLSIRLLTLSIALILLLPAARAEDLVLTAPELAGISGFRAYWDRPVVLAADGATQVVDQGRFGAGPVGDWSTDGPGAIVFDAVHRRVLVRFPQAAEAIARELAAGRAIERVELVLPFRDTEYFPLDYDRPAGMSFLGDMWVKTPPRWHVQAWALRRPWSADPTTGPTYNAAVNGKVYWQTYGAQDAGTDRYDTAFGPAEVSHEVMTGRLDITACLTDPAYGETPAQRLRQFADCGLMLRKWETYDARYWRGGYEWGVATGQRGILIDTPSLVVRFTDGPAVTLTLPPAATPTTAAPSGAPTAVTPTEADYLALKAQFALGRPSWAADWQWTRLQELQALGGGHGFPETYAAYLKWLDGMLSMHPRAWKGFTAAEMGVEYAMYHSAIPAPVTDILKLYWWAWLMPDRPYESLVHGYIGGKEAQAYYAETGDWRGNFSVYRTYLHSMGTVNFNSWATTGAMFGGWIIGDDGVMKEARQGYDHWMTRTWTWMDGSSQESVDHYYFAHTLGPLKAIADFAPGPDERLAGRLNTEKHLDELIGVWHPNLRRFISSSGRTGVAYPLYLQDGLNYIMHTLSRQGALTDVGAGEVAGRASAFAQEFAPGQVALQTQEGPWTSAAAGALVDAKPLPYAATRSYVMWGGYSQTPLWKKSYLGQHYGLASLDITSDETVPVMAQWRRTDAPVTSYRQLGTLLARYGLNDTEFLDSLDHGLGKHNPNGIVGQQGGSTLTVQGRNSAIILGSPAPDLKSAHRLRGMPEAVHSLQMSLALFNFEATPGWRLYVDGKAVESLPARARFGQRLTIHDGVAYIGIIPLPATAAGERDTEVLISAKGEPTKMQGGGTVKVTLTIDAYSYRSDTPLALPTDAASDVARQLDQAVAGYVVQLGDATEHADFTAFQAWFAARPCSTRWEPEAGVYHVDYGADADRLEVGYNPTAPLSQPTTQAFPYRRFGGAWPYLAEGVHRDTTTAIQSTTGQLEKNGATLTTAPGKMAYLQAFPPPAGDAAKGGVYVAVNPYRDAVPLDFRAPGGQRLQADGLMRQTRVELNAAENTVLLAYVPAPAGDDATLARALVLTGFATQPVVGLNGEPVLPVAVPGGYAIPLVTDWTPAMAAQLESRLRP